MGAMLDRLIGGVLTPEGAKVLGLLLQPLLFRLTECVEAQLADGGHLAADHPAVSLIIKLTVEVTPASCFSLMHASNPFAHGISANVVRCRLR